MGVGIGIGLRVKGPRGRKVGDGEAMMPGGSWRCCYFTLLDECRRVGVK